MNENCKMLQKSFLKTAFALTFLLEYATKQMESVNICDPLFFESVICCKLHLQNNIFYKHLIDSGVEENHMIRFAFDSAADLYLIEENFIAIEKKTGITRRNYI